MKKTLLIVASLALGTAAVAQDQPSAAPTQDTPAAAAPAGPESQPAMQPGSDPATAPAGATSDVTSPSPSAANGMSGNMGASSGNMAQAQQMASSTDTSNYPKCSRTVTDKCVSAGKAMGGKRMARRSR